MKFQENKKSFLAVLGILFFLNVFAWIGVYYLSRQQLLAVDFLAVGQGDSVFIETPKGQQVLIDGGPDDTVLEKLATAMPFYDRTIDLVVLTHPEKDHLFGLLGVLKKYKIKNILWTGIVRETAEWQEWSRLVKEEGAKIEIAQAGERAVLQENPLIYLDVLSPYKSLDGQKIAESNDTSIVNRLVFKNSSFLFMGDATIKTENNLIAKNVLLDSDVLKIGHHGSKTSTSENFVKSVSPETAVIEVGENNYGHPTPEVLAILKKFGIQTLRTDKDGDIIIFSDGKNLKIVQ
jgi:competence protein ComEC